MARYSSKGTIIKIGGTKIGQVKKITPPPMKMGTVEVTDLDSIGKEYLATILDGGEPKLSILWDPATHTTLYTTFKAGTLSTFQIVLANSGGTFNFSAIITEFPMAELDPETVDMIDLTLRTSGDVTIT